MTHLRDWAMCVAFFPTRTRYQYATKMDRLSISRCDVVMYPFGNIFALR